MRAAEMFAAGAISQADIGRNIGVSHQTVSDWHAVWRKGGAEALRGAGRAGRRPKLTARQLAEVEAALEKGPKANGNGTDLWTLLRVAKVIEACACRKRHLDPSTWTLVAVTLMTKMERGTLLPLHRFRPFAPTGSALVSEQQDLAIEVVMLRHEVAVLRRHRRDVDSNTLGSAGKPEGCRRVRPQRPERGPR